MKKLCNRIQSHTNRFCARTATLLRDRRGDLATNTIGGIIVAVVIIGLLVAAIKLFFPDFFGDMFDTMADKLNANW